MKANRIHRFGSPQVIQLEEADRPLPGPEEVLVRVIASGVGPWDGWIREGKSVLPQPLPLTLGSDLSGVIETLGPDVQGFNIGDEVFGVTNPRFTGANADYAVASTHMIAAKPKTVSHIEAASVPVVAVTAWQMLFDHGGVKPGQTALILGAAGSVGSYAVQLAHAAGVRVIASASRDEAEYVRSLGADRVFDGRADGIPEDLNEIDAAIDAVGGEAQSRSLVTLRRGGVLISAVSQPDQSTADRLGVKAAFMLVDVTSATLSSISARLDANKLKTNVATVLPLSDARIAHEMLEGTRPRPRGKIVLQNFE
jgi:NADPH:quinone reductase-like Zn-dependent oxidoreductase